MAAKKKKPAAKKKAKRKSGGARATLAKHRQRDAARRRLEAGQSVEHTSHRFKQLLDTAPASDADTSARIKWLAAVCVEAVVDALNDVGLPPEQRRDQIVRMAEKAMKVCEPAKLAEQLDELYAEYEQLEQTIRTGGGEGDAG